MNQYEIIIIGGGMIGAATALGLAKLRKNVLLIEKNPLPEFSPEAQYDVRISAINVASVALLKSLGVWDSISAMRVCPYSGLETWEIDGLGISFRAADLNLNELGYMVENKVIQLALWQALADYPNCQKVIGFKQISANKTEKSWEITLDNTHSFSAPLLIAADGANSLARRWAKIGLTSWQYRQQCLLAIVKTQHPQQNTTWQQFYPSGPRAFLPLLGNQGCIVWYDTPQRILQLTQCHPAKLSAEIMNNFHFRLGQIEVETCQSFSLTRQHAQQYSKNGVILVGDAAHTINPLAGQGVNLGFRDVQKLLQLFKQIALNKTDIQRALIAYQRSRYPDNLIMQTGMDVFYKTFKTEHFPLKIARNLGLSFVQHNLCLKRKTLQYALGLLS